MEENRLLVVGDIHGEYDMLCSILEQAEYRPRKDRLFFVGDYIDRGDQSRKVVKKIKELTDQGAVAIRGNHEEMAKNYIEKDGQDNGLYFQNGGRKTLDCYSDFSSFREDMMWLGNLPLKKVLKGQYIFVHAGLKPGIQLEKQDKHDLLWIRNEFFMYDWTENDLDETIIAGHTPFPEVKKFSEKTMIIDTGAGKGGHLSMVDLTNNKIYKAG